MIVSALDLSLRATGVASNHGGVPSAWTITPGARSGAERLFYMQKMIDQATEAADVVCLEGYAFGRPNQAHQIGELGGVVRLTLYARRRPFVEIPPAVVKKLATGNGGAKKEAVLVEAVKRLEYPGADNNCADALWILQAALHHYGLPGAVRLPKTHLDALAKVKWPEIHPR